MRRVLPKRWTRSRFAWWLAEFILNSQIVDTAYDGAWRWRRWRKP